MAWSRYWGIGDESGGSYGTPVALTKYIPLWDETMDLKNNIQRADSAENQWYVKRRAGKFEVGGNVNFAIEPENCGLVLKTILPTVTSALLCGTTKKHTFKPSVTTWPFYTSEIGTDITAGAKRVTSAMSTKLTVKAESNGLLMGNLGYFGQTYNQQALATPSYSTLLPFVGSETTVEIATVLDANVESITFNFEKDRRQDAGILGSRFHPRNASTGRFRVYGTMDLSFESLTQQKRFLGSASSTSPETQTLTGVQLELLTTGIATGDGSETYAFNCIAPAVDFDTYSNNIVKSDRTVENLPWEGIYTSGAACPGYIELQNQVASY